MNYKTLFFLILLFAWLILPNKVLSQFKYRYGVNYTTEGQYSFKTGHFAWANLLDVSASVDLWKDAHADIEVVSTYITPKDGLSECSFGYSNIMAENRWFRLYNLSLTQEIGPVTLGAGLRNLNSEFISSPYTVFFAGPSLGFFPTLDLNFTLANYPYSSWGVHADWQIMDKLKARVCLYNADASDRLSHQFDFDWKGDGICSVAEFCWYNDSEDELAGSYHLGGCWDSNTSNQSYWLIAEHPFWRVEDKLVGALVEGGLASGKQSELACNKYVGLGGYTEGLLGKEHQAGIVWIYSKLEKHSENSFELNYKMPLMEHWSVQPILHYITHHHCTEVIGLLRVNFVW